MDVGAYFAVLKYIIMAGTFIALVLIFVYILSRKEK